MEIALWICFAIGVLFGLHNVLLWMETKDWIYYRRKRSSSGSTSALEATAIFDPSARAAVEARDERAGEEDENDGDDNKKRIAGRRG
ncbi:MAG TPA: hypothetical protein PK050_17035 [Hyphomonadaceae bacterium]|jgi:hypothetical protein|nr:hypothetical protein [Hyphomonadaceae bacterium]HPN07518.1 hypothetical protein [Hyphomonadaceae bacterium]